VKGKNESGTKMPKVHLIISPKKYSKQTKGWLGDLKSTLISLSTLPKKTLFDLHFLDYFFYSVQ